MYEISSLQQLNNFTWGGRKITPPPPHNKSQTHATTPLTYNIILNTVPEAGSST